jgi:glycosyltransferase involved in cell wall biosynthesis
LRQRIIIIGSLPPPYIGPSVATEIILGSSLSKVFELIHLDTSDHRELSNLATIDFMNIYLALRQYIQLFIRIVTYRPAIVYIPISQTTIGYLRDAGFILISKLFGRKVLCHLRGGNFKNWFDSASFLTRWFVRRVHFLVDGQIVLGVKLINLFDGIIKKEKIFVVPNGRNFNVGSNSRRPSGKINILYLANLIPSKGFIDVLNACPSIYRIFNHVEFIFAGSFNDAKTQNEVDKFLERNAGLPIRFEGTVWGQKKHDLLAGADIFVFPTYYPPEGHPWVIIEALAAGLPIITTDQGAITESVIDGVNGFIVEKKNPEQIAEKIKLLIENPQLRQRMGRESRRMYLENFTEKKMVERLTSAFNKVLEN